MMVAIIIFVAIAIVGFIIYQLLPSTRFQKANSFFDCGNLVEAIKIYDSIISKHPDAPAKLAECKLKAGINAKSKNENEAIKYFNDIILIKRRLTNKANMIKFALVESKANFEIAQLNFNKICLDYNLEYKTTKLKENLRYIDISIKNGCENDFLALRNKHLSELEEINFYVAKQFEKTENFEDAIQFYSMANDFAEQLTNSKFKYSSLARIAICNLKKIKSVESIDFHVLNQSPVEYKKDFYYRYVIKLLYEENYIEAESFLSENLNYTSPAIDKLKEIIRNRKTNVAIEIVNNINQDLDQLYEKSFPVDDVKNLYDTLDKNIEQVILGIPNLDIKLQELKPSLFNRLLINYINDEKYAQAINLIRKFPLFWESPQLLKNLGISCFGYTAQGNLTEKNYPMVISSWLTAVYSDKVILKSLEDTSWDDEYTFSLSNSIGSFYAHHSELPVNVNYDDISDTNISIGAAQKELLQQFEVLINQKILDSSLAQNVDDFYHQEKEAIEKIISVINQDILFAAPRFAKLYGINDNIIEILNNDYVEYGLEESLEVGIPYLNNNSEGSVKEYGKAKDAITGIISSIQSEDISKLKTNLSSVNKLLIEKFESTRESVEDLIYNTFFTKIEENDENEKLINLMSECINFCAQNEKLRFQCSNYIADFCVAKVNEGEIDNYKALSLIKNAYLYSLDNQRISQNIITLIRMNLMDILNKRTIHANSIYKILDEIIPKRSLAFKEFSFELFQARKDLLDQLKESGVEISILTTESLISSFHDSYESSLTEEGIKLKSVLSYLKKLSEGCPIISNTDNDQLSQIRQQLGLSTDLRI